MTLKLRPYQSSAIADVLAALDRSPILVLPTGAGKTVCAVEVVKRHGGHCLWLAHRMELIEQAATRLEAHGLNVGIIKAGYPAAPLMRVQVASVQTLVRRDPPPADLIIIDECHHAAAQSYRTILDAYPGVPLVGLTATPFRLDGRGLGDLYGDLVIAATPAELCDQGYLHAPKVWASHSPDLRGVKVTAGDYNLRALAERVNTSKLVGDIVETWQKRAAGRRTVAFAVDIEHSRAIVDAFQMTGVPAEHLDGRTPLVNRESILRRLRSGETQVVSNCMVLTEGWDLPALECAIVARPTASLNLHLQMIGRIMRASEGKAGAVVLDHAGNHHVHGLVTRRLNYSLDGDSKVGFDEPLGLRRCSACGLFFDSGEPACPECGWVPERVSRERPGVQGDGELTEFVEDFEYQREFWQSTEAQREGMLYQEGWSAYRYKERFGDWPVLAGRELVDVENATREEKEAVYRQFVELAAEKGFKPGWASHRYRGVFGVWPKGFVRNTRRESMARRFDDAMKGAPE